MRTGSQEKISAMCLGHRLVLTCLLVSAFAGCGKSDVASVNRPRLPIYYCRPMAPLGEREGTTAEPCEHPFNAAPLVGMKLKAAERLAAAHGFSIRRVAPLPDGEGLTADEVFNRLDVECDTTADDCIVVRIVERG